MNIIRRPFRYVNFNSVFWLIGINVLVFIATYFSSQRNQQYMITHLSMIPYAVIELKWVWTFVTYMFVHGGFSHILFNMFALFIFGVQVERYMGSREFVLFYLVTGALAGIFSFFVYYFTGQYGVWLMGASGAIFAVELAYAIFYPHSIIYIWGILPLRAPVMVLGFTALELFNSIFARNTGVAHLTHLAGFGFAWLYFVIRFGINPWHKFINRRD